MTMYHTFPGRSLSGAKTVGWPTTLLELPKEVHPSEDVSKPRVVPKTLSAHAGGSTLCEKTDEAPNDGPEPASTVCVPSNDLLPANKTKEDKYVCRDRGYSNHRTVCTHLTETVRYKYT